MQGVYKYDYLYPCVTGNRVWGDILCFHVWISDEALKNCSWYDTVVHSESGIQSWSCINDLLPYFYTVSVSWPVSHQLSLTGCSLNLCLYFKVIVLINDKFLFLHLNTKLCIKSLWYVQDFAASQDLSPHWRFCLFYLKWFCFEHLVLCCWNLSLSFGLFCKRCRKNSLWTHK